MVKGSRALCLMLIIGATYSRLMAAEPDPFRPPAITVENVPVIPAELIERLAQYQNVRSAAFRGWSPDGKGILIATRFGDTTQLHRVYEPGGRREQITFFTEPADGRFIPEAPDGAVLVVMSHGGNENHQIYRLDRTTGRSTLLTDGSSRNLLGPLRPDGSAAVIASNRRNGRDTDLYLGDPRNADSWTLLLQTDGEFWTARDWSRDGKTLLINRYVSINESYPALLDIASHEKRLLPIPDGGPAAFGAMKFAPDGRAVYLASDAQSEFRQLARLDLDSMGYTWLSREIPWNVEDIEVEPNSGLVAFTVNQDGAGGLYLLRGDRYESVDLPLGTISSLEFSPDGQHLGFTLSRPDAPADAYSIHLADKSLTRWTYSEVGGLNPATFVTPERFRYETFDGRKVPVYYFKPRGATPATPVPVLISIHGGPESQYRPVFNGTEQYYLNELGIAVLHPNVRGSDGYGKEYLRLDNAQRREDSVRDIGALLDWIAKQPELDRNRVAVIGASYGGYMVRGTLVHYSHRLQAGVDMVGIASFQSFLQNTSAYRQNLRRAEYGDERDPAMQTFFRKIDPLHNAERIKARLMLVHGRNDPRVPFSEAVQIAEKVRASGQSVWTVYADNEGHGFAKKANRDYMTAAIVLFLREALKPSE